MTKKITKIGMQKRPGRYNIFLDEKYAFSVSESVLINFRLAKDMEIDGQLEKLILADDDVAKAYSKALNYLAHQLRAESEVITKLKELELDDNVIDEVMQKLREQNLIDDQNYADSYVRTIMLTSDKGPSVIRQNLRQKKIGENLIDQALQQYPEDALLENGTKLAEKQLKHYHHFPVKVRLQKVRQSMMIKGFKGDLITQILNNITIKEDPDEEWENMKAQAQKLWQRNRKYAFRERILRTKRSLFGKGYSTEFINRWIEEQKI
ncbi:regulatory protein RecX [Paucilactobacillus hokkaidonensis JCM 18461]|uniref:Regulatory protein RecX n=2 Tax=Paucilactobacillus hokkaidonensis TaxID=1193095 RepID=A0A0A1GTC0_9LACO|nr:recombination regulator RecX [Paucilactobacillus hokkaidonensis]BAP85215.1 regulatory protein RecX [Paucilactobacillus hokkaidonensis JCM 18461]